MSGLAAVYERDGAPAAEARISGMLDRLAHRGPDRRAHLCLGPVALGQCLLETTPEDALDRQPERSERARRWIVADARLDNRKELLAARKASGEADGLLSDARVILWAYERWGRDCPQHLLGDFAFVIWDDEARRLFCARDPVGVRQLYYHHDGGAFRAASEMHALFADERVPRRPSSRSMALFLTSQYTESKETLWEGVSALSPGHHLTVTRDAIREDRYWRFDPSRQVHHRDDAGYAEHFHHVFSEAVQCRLRSNRPLAAQVSGGLDSSSVACEVERLRREGRGSPDPLLLMRCLFPGMECDERKYSQAVASHLNLPIVTFSAPDDPNICRPEPKQLAADCYFEPTVRAPSALLGMAQQRGIRTTLTGIGGDDLMRCTGAEGAAALRGGHLLAAATTAGVTSRPLSLGGWRALLRDGLAAFAPPRALHPLQRLRNPARRRWPWASSKVAHEAMAAQEKVEEEDFERYPDPVVRELAGPLATGRYLSLPLALVDRHAARAGAELRHPFLDVRVLELLLAFPHAQRFDGEIAKPVLRRAMAGVLPAEIQERRLITYFTCYVHRCVFEEHHEAVAQLLDGGFLEQASALDRGGVQGLLADRGSKKVISLLKPLALELWLRQSFDTGSAAAIPTIG